MRTVIVVVTTALVVMADAAETAETDQYWAWDRPLADSTAAVNAKFNLELERALEEAGGGQPPGECRAVAAAFRSRMRSVLFHEIMVWAWNTRWVDRIPDGGKAQREYRATNLYSRHRVIDPGTWMPYAPTILVADVRFGLDKISHLVSSGWTTYAEYHHHLSKGAAPDEARDRAVRRSVLEESLVLGRLTSRVLSVADLEASFSGFRMYRDLCDVEDPILAVENGVWTATRPLNLADYVTPRWDESFQPPIYTRGRWKKVKPVLEEYCDRSMHPQVAAMRLRYEDRDASSPVSKAIAERVASGKLEDPQSFGLEAVCPGGWPDRDAPAPAELGPPPSSTEGVDDLRQAVIDEEADRKRSVLVMPGVRLAYPQVLSVSLAFLLTRRTVGWDCRTPCRFSGPFAEVEPGLGAGKLSFGWARVTGATNAETRFLKAAFMGAAAKLTVLRTWGDDGWLPGGQTYAGLELAVMPARANVEIGVLYRVDGGDGRSWTVTAGAGWGF